MRPWDIQWQRINCIHQREDDMGLNSMCGWDAPASWACAQKESVRSDCEQFQSSSCLPANGENPPRKKGRFSCTEITIVTIVTEYCDGTDFLKSLCIDMSVKLLSTRHIGYRATDVFVILQVKRYGICYSNRVHKRFFSADGCQNSIRWRMWTYN